MLYIDIYVYTCGHITFFLHDDCVSMATSKVVENKSERGGGIAALLRGGYIHISNNFAAYISNSCIYDPSQIDIPNNRYLQKKIRSRNHQLSIEHMF